MSTTKNVYTLRIIFCVKMQKKFPGHFWPRVRPLKIPDPGPARVRVLDNPGYRLTKSGIEKVEVQIGT